MSNNNLLPFVDNERLYHHVKSVLDAAQNAADSAENNLYSNVIDPFSAVFDSMRQGINLHDWLEQEKSRQIQKTLQNALGEFHQNIIGSIAHWENLGTGSVIDVCCRKERIIAEIKNKWNTTKGTDKKTIYDNLKTQLKKGEFEGFTGYYVEVIPKSPSQYDNPFTPPDNLKHIKRQTNRKIRIIDGKSFYALASGDPDAIDKLYYVLPKLVGDILKKSAGEVEKDPLFTKLFKSAY